MRRMVQYVPRLPAGTVTPHAATLVNLVERATREALGRVGDAQVIEIARRARGFMAG